MWAVGFVWAVVGFFVLFLPPMRAPVELDVGESDAQGWVANGLLVSIG